MLLKVFLINLTIFVFYVSSEEPILCSKDFCLSYIKATKCRDLPEKCKIQNETYNGLFLPFPGPCNCCDYCLENLDKGDLCTVGEASSSVPLQICGGGLSCEKTTTTPACKEMDTACTRDQKKYDNDRLNGRLGHLQVRPECDDDGTYKPYRIIPGEIVYCVSDDGQRIFGEVPEATFNKNEFNCKCSRSYHNTKKLLNKNLHKVEHFRCKSNGDYDALQCLAAYCLCANEIDGALINDSQALVKIDKISNATLECFDNKTHVEFEYYRECESKYRKEFALIKEQILNGFEALEVSLPKCQLDGYYEPVQKNETSTFCVDPYGKILENFVVEIDNSLGKDMDCKCARARSIIMDIEKPICCDNGNYQKMQCRRGKCHCVDRDGHQIKKEVDFEEKEKLCCGGDPLCSNDSLC